MYIVVQTFFITIQMLNIHRIIPILVHMQLTDRALKHYE